METIDVHAETGNQPKPSVNQNNYMQSLGQTSASNISSALSSITGMNVTSHASHANVDNSTSHAAVNSSTTQKGSTPYMLSQQKNLYSGSNQHSAETSHVSSNYSNPRPPSASNKPNIFKGYEEKEREQISYSSMEKKRTSNPTAGVHAEPDPYSKKYAVATQLGGPTMLTTQLGMNRDHGSQGTSSKYNAPMGYQQGASKSSQEKHPVSYGLGKSSQDASAHPSKPTGSKYGLMNPNLNKQTAFK